LKKYIQPGLIVKIVNSNEDHCFATSFIQIDSQKGSLFFTHTLIGFYISIGFAMMILIEYLVNILLDSPQVSDHKKNDDIKQKHSNYHLFRFLPTLILKFLKFILTIFGAIDKDTLLVLIGIIIHNIPEGIALGSYSEEYKDKTSEFSIYYVYFAIIIHKIPEALSLCTFLLSKNYKTLNILFYMIVISIISPSLSLITYWTLNLFLSENFSFKEVTISKFSLISSGSLLYVSTIHVFHDIFYLKDHSHNKGKLTR